MNNLRCPQCGLSHIKRNGYTHYGKQNYRCKDCDRQFVEDSQHIGEEVKDLIKVLLLERLSLRGICRVTGVSLTESIRFREGMRWHSAFVAAHALPESNALPKIYLVHSIKNSENHWQLLFVLASLSIWRALFPRSARVSRGFGDLLVTSQSCI